MLPMLLVATSLLDLGTLALVAAELVRSLQADLSSGQADGVSPPGHRPRPRPREEGGRAPPPREGTTRSISAKKRAASLSTSASPRTQPLASTSTATGSTVSTS